jgi:transcriptional regulator with XRE-family HTH domain
VVTHALKRAIADSGLSLYQISKDTGVSASVLTRFMNGERDIQLSTADKLAEFFSLQISIPKPTRKNRAK